MSSILLGIALSFTNPSGDALALTVSLTKPATAAVALDGRVVTSSAASRVQHFGPFPTPRSAPLEYELRIAGEKPQHERIRPLPLQGPLKIALLGDSRDGLGPYNEILHAVTAAQPDLVLHTGDISREGTDNQAWRDHLAITLALGASAPLLLSMGNHEVYIPQGKAGTPMDGLLRTLARLPPPTDPLARSSGVSPAAFHVRVGPVLIISLDSNTDIGPESAQRKFTEAALKERGDARFTLIMMHHGPLSSGPHGSHPEEGWLRDLAVREHVTAILAGHDHLYERLLDRGVTVIVSGGAGAPLYDDTHALPESVHLVPTYHWALLELNGEHAQLTVRSLEGALLDQVDLTTLAAHPTPPAEPLGRGRLTLAIVLVVVAAAAVLGRLAFKRT